MMKDNNFSNTLDELILDAITNKNMTPQEIFESIRESVYKTYEYFESHSKRCHELLGMFDDGFIQSKSQEDNMPSWGHSDLEALSCNYTDKQLSSTMSYDDAIKDGWSMSADGFYFKE